MTTGRVNPSFKLEDQGITELGSVYYNLMEPALIEEALKKGEGELGNGGAFLVTTGKFTGRSPKDKHVVKTADVVDTIWWENNAEMSPEGFDALYADMIEHMKGRDYYVQDLVGGADPAHSIDVRVVTELACSSAQCCAAQSATHWMISPLISLLLTARRSKRTPQSTTAVQKL